MNLSQLMAQFRNFTDDKEAPYLWSDDEIKLYINEAQREVARRTRCLTTSNVNAVCQISVTAGNAFYQLDPRVIYIKSMKTSAHVGLVRPIRQKLMDEMDYAWETKTGRVDFYITDRDSRAITLYRIPDANQTLKMTVVRLPLADLSGPTDVPEVLSEYHLGMLNYAYYLAYSKQDVEAKSEDRSQMFYNRFEEEFGRKLTASALFEEFENENAGTWNDGRF